MKKEIFYKVTMLDILLPYKKLIEEAEKGAKVVFRQEVIKKEDGSIDPSKSTITFIARFDEPVPLPVVDRRIELNL